ncbi:MAG: hypothetical protein UZ07_CHB004003345 [Chlorobi bacterium OLB7]|nr:MAG: hypothetical protein UZ07_CHB004003345 [Chlorobi bacterium OLB7]
MAVGPVMVVVPNFTGLVPMLVIITLRRTALPTATEMLSNNVAGPAESWRVTAWPIMATMMLSPLAVVASICAERGPGVLPAIGV